MSPAPVNTLGAVYDRGYRPYEGELGGRGATRWALWRLTVRRALGLRRSWRQKVLPWTLLGLTMIPAAIDIGLRWSTRNSPLDAADIACRPVVTGNFLKNPVIATLDHSVGSEITAAETVDREGLFVGNHHYPIGPQLARLREVVQSVADRS